MSKNYDINNFFEMAELQCQMTCGGIRCASTSFKPCAKCNIQSCTWHGTNLQKKWLCFCCADSFVKTNALVLNVLLSLNIRISRMEDQMKKQTKDD